MGNNFKKFKKRARVFAILSSLLFGLCSGALTVGIPMLINKLFGREPDPMYYFIGIGAAIVVSVALYFIFMPSDKRLAKRLDKLYSLNEKISTMVEFRDNDGVFYRIQREDAEEQLGQQPRGQMKSKALLCGIISLFVSIALLVGAIVMPVMVKVELEAPIDEFDKQYIIVSLEELIVEVQNDAFMTEGLKGEILTSLNELLAFVKESNLMSEMKREATKAVVSVNASTYKVNSAVAIGEKFETSTDERISNLGKQMRLLLGSEVQKAISNLGDSLSGASDTAFVAGELDSYLKASGVAIDDSVYVVFSRMIADMKSGDSDAFTEAKNTILNHMMIQNYNAARSGYVISTLCKLFGITQDDLANEGVDIVVPEQNTPGITPGGEDGGNGDDDEDPPLGSGGLGTGDVIYGSNDMIFDPNKNTYVPYGELLNEYYAKVDELIKDGKTSEEISKLAEYYYGLLFGSNT